MFLIVMAIQTSVTRECAPLTIRGQLSPSFSLDPKQLREEG